MAIPTLQQVKDVMIPWWRAPGRPRLDVLRARLAALCTDPGEAIMCAIVNIPPWSLVMRYILRDVNTGAVLNQVTRTLNKTDLDALVNREVYQVCDDDNRTPEERGDPL